MTSPSRVSRGQGRSRCIRRDNVRIVKRRITLSIDPAVSRRAKKLAHVKKASVSALVEQFLRSAPIAGGQTATSFVERWAGKFRAATTGPGDLRMKAIKAKHHLKAR